MTRAFLVPLSVASALLAGCSALGLDRFPQATCTRDRDCEGLPPPADDCLSWQCDRTTDHCMLDLLDADEDGFARMTSPSMAICAMDARVDCDDAAATTFPTAAELCNGLDDDCDGLVDDGVAAATTDLPLRAMGEARSGVVARAPGGDEAGLVALLQVDTGTRPRRTILVRRAGGAPVEASLTTMVTGPTASSPIDLGRGAEALVALGERFVVLFAPEGSCRRLALAATDATGSRLDAPQALHEAGLPTLDPSPACQAASRGALAADVASDRFLAAYANPAGAACGAVSASTVLAIGGSLVGALPELDATAPVVIGSSVDHLAPALVSAGVAGAFFVAFPTASAIEIHRVDVASGTAMRLAEVPVSGASAVTVALDGSTLALGWSEDCGASPARIRLFAVAGTTLTPGPEATLSRGADALCITRQGVLEEWGIALEDAEGWWLERRDDRGAELGPPVPVRGIASEVRPLVRARSSGGAYEIFGAEAGLFVDAGRLTLDTVACLP